MTVGADAAAPSRVARPAHPVRRWLAARLAVLALLLVPFTAVTVSTFPTAAGAQTAIVNPVVYVPKSIPPAGVLNPATAVVTATVACLFYCDDAYRWARDAWRDWRADAAVPKVGMEWVSQPATTSPTPDAGFILGLVPRDMQCTGLSGDPACPNEMQIGIQVRNVTCQLLNGNLWSPLMGDLSVKVVPANINSGNSGTRTIYPSEICPPFTDGTKTAVVAFELIRKTTYPGAGLEGSIGWAVDTAPVTATASATCRDLVNGTVQVMAAPTPVTWDAQTSPAIPSTACPDGFVRTGVKIDGGATWAPTQPIYERTENIDEVVRLYPDCTVQANACRLAPVTDPDTGQTVCKWGPYTMPLSDCDGLVAEPVPTTSPAPSTQPTPTASPLPTYPLPRMPPGRPLPQGTPTITTQPDPRDPTRQCTTWTYPDGSVVRNCLAPDGSGVVDLWPPGTPHPAPEPPPESHPLPPTTPTDPGVAGRDCIGTVITLDNPASWVYGPVVCALQWAFVPSQRPLDKVQAAAGDLGGKVPFSYVTGVVGWTDGLDGAGSACFTLDVATPGGSMQALNSCGGGFIGELRAHRVLLEAAVWAMFATPLGWWAWRQYAPGSTGVA